MKSLRLGKATVELHDGDLTVTKLPDGEVPAVPQDSGVYRARAERLGYGQDTARMSREHEVVHALLNAWLGLPYSPTLHGVATGREWPYWHLEEAAVLALQAYCRVHNIDIVELAERWADEL